MLPSTHRLVVRQLQTGLILHCSFAEVNGWEGEGGESSVSEGQHDHHAALKALNGPVV